MVNEHCEDLKIARNVIRKFLRHSKEHSNSQDFNGPSIWANGLE